MTMIRALLLCVLWTSASHGYVSVELLLNGAGVATEAQSYGGGGKPMLGWALMGMTEIAANREAGLLYQMDVELSVSDDHVVRHTLMPLMGLGIYTGSHFSLKGRGGIGMEYWRKTYTTDALEDEYYEPSYTRSAFLPIAALGVNEQFCYSWMGISANQQIKLHTNGVEVAINFGLLLRFASQKASEKSPSH